MKKQPHQITLILFLFCLSFLAMVFLEISAAHADVWTISFQNDVIFGTDEHYTNGLSIDWMGDILNNRDIGKFESKYSDFVYSVVTSFPMVDIKTDQISFGFGIGQDIFTPSDTSEEDLIKDDIPYAGHLYTKYSLFEWGEDETRETHFSLGMVGPISGAEQSQKAFHRLIDNEEPKGWHHQLPNQPTLGIGYSNTIKAYQTEFGNGAMIDWVNTYGLEIGNFTTGVVAGTLFRFGKGFSNKYVSANGIINTRTNNRFAFNSAGDSFGWAVNLGVYGTVLAYSLILDSSPEHEIDRKTIMGVGVFSISLYFKQFEITFSIQSIKMRKDDVIESMGWGGLSFSIDS